MTLGGMLCIILAEFLILALLGYAYITLIRLTTQLQYRKAEWLFACRLLARQARVFYRESVVLAALPMPIPFGKVGRRVLRLMKWTSRVMQIAQMRRC